MQACSLLITSTGKMPARRNRQNACITNIVAARQAMLTSSVFRQFKCDAENSVDGLCREAAAGLRIPCAALLAMAFSFAPPTFQCAPSPGTQLGPLDSGFRHRSLRHATNPARDSGVGARETFWFVKLAGRPVLDR